MKRTIPLALFSATLLLLTACGSQPSAEADSHAAVGVIFVSGSQTLPTTEKVYAQFADREYTFPFDAACVYYVDTQEDGQAVTYAGDQNLTQLTFGAEVDGDTVAAQGAAVFCPQEGSTNTVTAYYLCQDETGVYFDPATPFDTQEITGEVTFTGTDYPCSITFTLGQPIQRLTMVCLDGAGGELSRQQADLAQLADYQTFPLDSAVASVQLTCYDAAGQVLETLTILPETPSPVLCCHSDGQILASRVLRFSWPAEA